MAPLAMLAAAPACAQDTSAIFTPETLTVAADLRAVVSNGERSWIDGGFGRTRFDARDDPAVVPVEADLIWQPRFTWSLTGTVVATAQAGQDHALDLSEAYVAFKPLMAGDTRLSARIGLMWPPVSTEHANAEWIVAETITPSAINAWIGEEVKLIGIEGSAVTTIGSQRIGATAALFGFNDTAGTLLAFRGWALHDQKAVAFGLQPLPPLNAFLQMVQAPRTRPVLEIDDRAGWYAKLGWSPAQPIEIAAFHYDNRGDPEAVNSTLQWGWRTRFDNLAATLALGRTTLKAQAMAGRTEMGFPGEGGRIWIDTRFRSAFLLATRAFGAGSVSARIEAFGAHDRGSKLGPSFDEDGWAVTGAARQPIGEHLTLLAETLHVDSRKAARALAGDAAHQAETTVQIALRARF